MAKRDFYEVLGVNKSADEKAIKRAYRKLAKKYHPDTNQGNKTAELKFKEASEAYDILGDEKKKKLYDAFGMEAYEANFDEEVLKNRRSYRSYAGATPGSGGSYQEFHFTDGDMGHIFDEFFGSGFRQGGFSFHDGGFAQNRGSSGGDIQAEISVSFEEAALGCEKTFRLEGEKNGITVKIPAGIDEGQSIRLKGKGRTGPDGQAGHLLLKIHIMPDARYERKGKDVYSKEAIPFTTAALGGKAVFQTIHGPVECSVPAGTQSGSKIRLRNKGIVDMKNGRSFGDAYVEIKIAVPRKMSEAERKVVENLRKVQRVG